MTSVSVPAAALGGLVSFLSPCVLPLVPGYLAFVSGTSVLAAEGSARVPLARLFARAGAFVLGFTTVFVLLGASATEVGQFLASRGALFAKIAGLVVMVFGLHLLGVLKIPMLYREKRALPSARPRSHAGAFAIGTAFAFGWTPCIGPILGAVLALAAVEESVWHGMGLLAVYSLGLGVPFLLAALGTGYLAQFLARFRRFYQAVEIASGLLLIGVGALIFSGRLTWLSGQLGWLRRFAL
jgi:cytochrome c-type biogenesis protein